MRHYDVADESALYFKLRDVLTGEKYVCFKDLLMEIVAKRDMNIDGNHTIDIIHSVDH